MAHLVNPINQPNDSPIPISKAVSLLKSAHHYLTRLGNAALKNNIASSENWGTEMKRLKISFPKADRPQLISSTHETHSLTEVINQCATIERLMDALVWADSNLPKYQLLRCHPTTSSQKVEPSDIPDNDIVLINEQGRLARFEVSDISGDHSATKKIGKELSSLGAPLKDKIRCDNPFHGLLFIVVSAELGERLRRRTEAYFKRYQPHFRYQEYPCTETTCIFEIIAPE